jgi:hypothetical protein
MSVADINTRVDAAVAAIDAGDYDSAYSKLLSAQALLAATPDSQKNSASLRFDRAAIAALIDTVRREIGRASGGRGVVRQNVVYKRVGRSGSDCD